MTIKVFKFLLLALCINIAFFPGISAEKKKDQAKMAIVTPEKSSIKNIIFDLGDVLFEQTRAKRATAIIPIALRYPSLIYTFMTQNIKHEIFTVLKNIPARSKQDEAMYNGGKKMPPIMVDWMTGRPTQEILEETKKYIKSSNYSSGEKALFLKIADMIFQPDKLIQVLDPIKPMVQLAKSMKNKGYKLYVLSNWDHESFPLMLKKHAEIFNLFDGILISGTQGMGKPNPKFYKKLMKTYKLRPKETIFIDDEPYNIQAAEKLGIHGVLKDSYQSVINQMTELEIIKIEKS